MTTRLDLRLIANASRSFKDDERGVVLILGALIIPILLFATGLIVDVSSWLQERSNAQYAAHFAAVAGAEVLGTQVELSPARETRRWQLRQETVTHQE